MSKRSIAASKTAKLNGTLAAADALTVQGGPAADGAGGTGVVTRSLTNSGLITVAGGDTAMADGQLGGQGGLLDVFGVLNDAGRIFIEAGKSDFSGYAAGQGGRMDVTGTLSINENGTVVLQGGTSSTDPNSGVLLNSGQINNSGAIVLGGSQPGGAFGSLFTNVGSIANSGTVTIEATSLQNLPFFATGHHGATLDDSGVLTNSGLIVVDGGIGGSYGYNKPNPGGDGGVLNVDGVLLNQATIQLNGGGAAFANRSFGGDGSQLNVSGTLTNVGTITVGAGQNNAAFQSGPGTGAVLSIAGDMQNSGRIVLQGADASYLPTYLSAAPASGVLSVTGTASSTGTILVAGGTGAESTVQPSFSKGQGGVLVDSGTFYAGGLLTIGGGGAATIASGYGGLGGTVTVNGAGNFISFGTLLVQGGEGAALAGAKPGFGGNLDLGGNYATNSGLLAVQAGGNGAGGGSGGLGGTFTIETGVRFSNRSTISIEAGNTGPGGGGAGQLVLAAGVGIDNMYGYIRNSGVLQLGSGAGIYSGLINNSGVILGSGSLDYLDVVNDGVIDAGAGHLTLNTYNITTADGLGSFHVANGGLLTVTMGQITGTQAVHLDGTSAALSVMANNAQLLVVSPEGGTVDVAGGGAATINAADTNLSVFLLSGTVLTLSRMSAIDATGSSSADKITALAAGQILTGGLGNDLLTGASATGDVFRDIAAGLNGDTIAGFAGTDTIDITDLAPGAGLTLAYAQQGATGKLTLSEGSASATITLQGQFTTASFTTGSDLHGGLLVGLHG